MSLFRDINDAQCLSLDGHAVDRWNSCLKPSLSCQHNSGVHGGSRGRAAGVQLRVSVLEIKLFRRQNVPQCFHTVSFALKIKTTQGCSLVLRGCFRNPWMPQELLGSGCVWNLLPSRAQGCLVLETNRVLLAAVCKTQLSKAWQQFWEKKYQIWFSLRQSLQCWLSLLGKEG